MQLTEFIISDNLHVWTKNGALDSSKLHMYYCYLIIHFIYED